jgi:hypothetical protein
VRTKKVHRQKRGDQYMQKSINDFEKTAHYFIQNSTEDIEKLHCLFHPKLNRRCYKTLAYLFHAKLNRRCWRNRILFHPKLNRKVFEKHMLQVDNVSWNKAQTKN